MISQYNTKPYPVMVSTRFICLITMQNLLHQNLGSIVGKEIKLYGFIVGSILPKYKDAFYVEVPALIASGKFKLKEDLAKGLESVGEAILAVQKGTNTGKSVIIVAD